MWDLFVSLIKTMFALFDRLIAWVIDQAYNLLMLIADTNIFANQAIEAFGNRIYALLALFMLFKLTFSLVNYLIYPDEFTGKEKGGKKLILNVLLVLLFIPSFPILFKQAYNLQEIILKNHVLEQVVFGYPLQSATGNISENGEQNQNNPMGTLSFEVFTAFFQPNENVVPNCSSIYSIVQDDPNDVKFPENCESQLQSILGNKGMSNLREALVSKNVDSLLSWELISAKESGEFVFNYKWLISTAVGVVVALIMIIFCVDVSIRAVKLGFLELIAPIPIVSYIDPKSGKDGIFKKWLTTVIKTFLDLFIRLIGIFFAIYIISLLARYPMESISTGEPVTNPFVKIFIIIGALLFAKQLPNLISDITGVKFDSGMFTLNPMKKIGGAPLLGGAAAAGMTVAGAGIAGGAKALGRLGWAGLSRIPIGGKDQAQERFQYNLEKAKGTFMDHMTAGKDVALQRFKTAGIAGSEKVADVDGVGKVLAKRRADEAKLMKRELIKKGEKIAQKVQEAKKRDPNIKKSDILFSSPKYRQSYENLDKAKKTMYKAKDAVAIAQSRYAAAASRNDQAEMAHWEEQYKKAVQISGKAAGKYEDLKKYHEEIRKLYPSDAKIEDAYDAYEKWNSEVEAPTLESYTPITEPSAPPTPPTGGGMGATPPKSNDLPKIDPDTGYVLNDSGLYVPPNDKKNENSEK